MPKLTKTPQGFLWEGGFEDRLLPKEAKFKWSPTRKQWWTDEPGKALILIAYADPCTSNYLQGYQVIKVEALKASRARDSTLEIPVPDGLEYMPFQKAGIEFAVNIFGTGKGY